MSLGVVTVEAFTVEPSPVASSVSGILQPRLKGDVDRKVGWISPFVKILQSVLESRLGLMLGLAVQGLQLAGCALLLGAPFRVFAFGDAAFRNHVVYSCGVRNRRSRQEFCGKRAFAGERVSSFSLSRRLHSFGL